MISRRQFSAACAAALAGAAASASSAPIPEDYAPVFEMGPGKRYGRVFSGTW